MESSNNPTDKQQIPEHVVVDNFPTQTHVILDNVSTSVHSSIDNFPESYSVTVRNWPNERIRITDIINIVLAALTLLVGTAALIIGSVAYQDAKRVGDLTATANKQDSQINSLATIVDNQEKANRNLARTDSDLLKQAKILTGIARDISKQLKLSRKSEKRIENSLHDDVENDSTYLRGIIDDLENVILPWTLNNAFYTDPKFQPTRETRIALRDKIDECIALVDPAIKNNLWLNNHLYNKKVFEKTLKFFRVVRISVSVDYNDGSVDAQRNTFKAMDVISKNFPVDFFSLDKKIFADYLKRINQFF